MTKSSCEFLLQYYPTSFEFEDLCSTYIACCVFNNFLCYTAITLNIVTIHTLKKMSTLPKHLKTLLLSLAVSDVGVGLLSQPLYTLHLINRLQEENLSCYFYMAFDIIMISLFAIASFLGVVALSVDRFLAIHLHLRYQELVTHKRVVAVVILIWVLSAFFALLTVWVPLNSFSLILVIIGVVCLLLTTVVYIYYLLTESEVITGESQTEALMY